MDHSASRRTSLRLQSYAVDPIQFGLSVREMVELSRHVNGVLEMVAAAEKPLKIGNTNYNLDSIFHRALETWLKIYPDSPLKKIKGIG